MFHLLFVLEERESVIGVHRRSRNPEIEFRRTNFSLNGRPYRVSVNNAHVGTSKKEGKKRRRRFEKTDARKK